MTPPAFIGRYHVLGLLGQGAMGTVYRGRDEALDREVALKVMSAGHGADAESRMRFQREAKAAGRLQHPNIITIYELGEHEGSPFMAMELLEGVDLQRAIEGGLRPDPKVTLPIVLQLLAGLGYAHESGIVHRDVKPSNIFLPRGRPAKIMDFGVARLAGGMTTAGMVVGTPNYMSPEQVRAGPLDGRSDLFSAGLILYELVTGEKAYKGDSVVALLYKIAHEDPNLKLIPRGRQWERLRGVLGRSLAREPEGRYPDAPSMAAELEKALQDLGGSTNWATASDVGLIVRTTARAAVLEPTETPAPPAPLVAVAPAESPAPSLSRRPVIAIASGLGVVSVAVVAVALYTANRPSARDAPKGPASPAVAPSAVAARPSPLAASPKPALPSTAPPAGPSAPPPASPAAVPRPSPATAPSPLVAVAPSLAPAPPPSPEATAPNTAEPTPPEPAPESAQLDRAEDLFEKGRYAAAMAEAKAVLRREPGNVKARGLVEDAEVEIVVETRIREAAAALKKGDKEAALELVKAGLAVKPSDRRLLEMWKEAMKE